MAQTTNFRVFDANSTNTLTSDQFKSNAKVSGGFASGDTLPSNLLNTTLRQTSLICTALMEAFCGSNTTLNALSNLDDVVSALQAGISSGGGGTGYVTTDAFNTYTNQTNARLTTDEANIAANATEITKIKNGTTTLNVTAARALQADNATEATWADTASNADNAGWANLAAVSRGTVGAYSLEVHDTSYVLTQSTETVNAAIPTAHKYVRVLVGVNCPESGYYQCDAIVSFLINNDAAGGNKVIKNIAVGSTYANINVNLIRSANSFTVQTRLAGSSSAGNSKCAIFRVDSSTYPL